MKALLARAARLGLQWNAIKLAFSLGVGTGFIWMAILLTVPGALASIVGLM